MAEALDGKVKEVRLSPRLKTHPVCLTSDGDLSLEMEKVLNALPNDESAPDMKAERILEINQNHPIFSKLTELYSGNQSLLTAYSGILYNQALLIEGLPVDDPVAFSEAMCSVMTD